MKRFGEAQRGHKGLLFVFAWKDEETGSLIGTALGDSKEDFQAARPTCSRLWRAWTSRNSTILVGSLQGLSALLESSP